MRQRPIKFRIWVKEEDEDEPGRMVIPCWTGFPLNDDHTFEFEVNKGGDRSEYLCTSGIYQQFTGLKDSKGKDIFEGDILNLGDNYNSVVEWSDYMEGPCFALHEYYPDKKNDRWHSMEAYTTKKKILGNIYENPELMK